MVKTCSNCGNQTTDDRTRFCIKCGTQLSPPVSDLKTESGQTIKASLNTQLPPSNNENVKDKKRTDNTLVKSPLCPTCGAVLNQNSSYCPKCLVIVNPHLVDKTIAQLTSGNPLLCSTCGAAIKQNSAYCPECKTIYPLDKVAAAKKAAAEKREEEREEEELRRKEEAEKEVKLQRDIAKENIVKLQDSGNLHLIYNFITRYQNSNLIDQNFFNLKTVLAKKGSKLTDSELRAVISEVKEEGELEWVKRRILYNNPSSSDECIKNYIQVFGNVCNDIQRERKNIQRERLINYLTKILKDNFNYQGSLDSDLIRIEKEVELERFENSLTGQAAGNRITINDIDRINGYNFEHVLKELFEKNGISRSSHNPF